MKTYGFNLLPQRSRALVRKEEKRDNYSVAIAILPLSAALVWLILILVNFFVYEPQKLHWQQAIVSDNAVIYTQLLPILVKNGEMVTKTNALANVIDKDVQPEQLFRLIDRVYGEQVNGVIDPTFKIIGLSRNSTGSFTVTISAESYLRLAEVTRLFDTYKEIADIKLNNAAKDVETNRVSGNLTFVFITSTPTPTPIPSPTTNANTGQ